MRKTIIRNLAIFSGLVGIVAGSIVWAGCPSGTIAQGFDQNNQPICVVANTGNGGGTSSGNPPQSGGGVAFYGPGSVPVVTPEQEYTDLCMTNLTSLASMQLQTQLLKDKAVSSQVQAAAKIRAAELGTSCTKICKDFAAVSHQISWAHAHYITDSAIVAETKALIAKNPYPNLPGASELKSCMPAQVTQNWCPTSGTGVGGGPARIENPLDKIKVCVSGGDALKHMNFSDADAAHNCARPSIVDAFLRIEAEHQCVKDAKDAKEIKDAKEAAALKLANTSAAAPTASTISPLSSPPQSPRKH